MSNNSVAGLDAKYVESKPIDFSSDGDASTERSSRLHYLDWLRVILFFGVFLFHAVHSFGAFDWHIKNDKQSVAFTAVMLVFLYPWGLPFFFLIAGAGSRFALRRRNGR